MKNKTTSSPDFITDPDQLINEPPEQDLETIEAPIEESAQDSNEAKVLVGKPQEEIKLRRLMKQKLQTTSIPDLEFEDIEGNVTKFSDLYDYHKFLGCGSFGFVVSAIDRQSGQHLALKIVDAFNESSAQCLKKEALILSQLPYHPQVVQFNHIKEFVNYIVLAIENVEGGTLGDVMKIRQQSQLPLSEDECAQAIRGILLGLKHIHNNEYMHRDMKPSNVVVEDPSNLSTVKVVDFGLATKILSGRTGVDETCGTLVYQAPEQMMGETDYGKSVDIWATGFIMYEIISGMHPLYVRGEDKQSYKEKLKNFKGLDFPKGKFSDLARNLLEKLCCFRPSGRYKLEQALTHPWITRNFEGSIPRTAFEENIFRYEIDNKFRKIVNLSLFLSVTKNYSVIQEYKFKQAQELMRQESLIRQQERQKKAQELQQMILAQINTPPKVNPDATPQFGNLKADTSLPNITQEQFDDDERFLQEIFQLQSKKISVDMKESQNQHQQQQEEEFLFDRSQFELNQNQNSSLIESGEQSSKSTLSYVSNNLKETFKIGSKGGQSLQQISVDKNFQKPPLAAREGSTNNRDQNGRTQKSFRIHKGAKRGSQAIIAQTQITPNQQVINKVGGRFSPMKRRNELSENDILEGIEENQENDTGTLMGEVFSEQKKIRQGSVMRQQEEGKEIKMFKTRRNSSASLRKTQQQSGSRHQSDIDSEDRSITPNQKDIGGDFSMAAGKAQLKFKKGPGNKKPKNKARSIVKKRNTQPQKDNLTNQKTVNQVDSTKNKNGLVQNYQQYNTNSNSNPSIQKSIQKVTVRIDQPLPESINKSSFKEYQDITLQIPPVPNSQVAKRINSSARNNQLGARKVQPCETFDIIRHGPSLKDKSSESSFLQSPQRGSEINLSNQKSIQALLNLQQCAQDDPTIDEGLQQQLNNPQLNKKLPLPLSPFEQFLQSLMKQNSQEPSTNQTQSKKQQAQSSHPFMLMLSQDLQQTGSQKQRQHESLVRKTQMPSQYKLALDKKDEVAFSAKPQLNRISGGLIDNEYRNPNQMPNSEQVRNSSVILYTQQQQARQIPPQNQQNQQQLQQQISNISNFIKGKEQMMAMYQRMNNN